MLKSVIYLFFLLLLCGCNVQNKHKVPIAILTPVTHPSLEQVEKGIIQTMEALSPGRYEFFTYNAAGNKTLMRSELEEIARKDYALLFTIATAPSQMATELFSKRGLSTPIVFTCVNDPVGFNIVKSEETPGGTVTGVKELVNFPAELNALLQFKPSIKTILLVYDPSIPGLQKDQKQIEDILKEKDIRLITVETFQSNEIKAKATPFIDQADALLVLKDNTVVAGLDALIKLCDKHQVPLMTSELDSPGRGAAFGYGVLEIDFGVEAAKKALLILEQGVPPGDIPVTPVAQFNLLINPDAALRQGIEPANLKLNK
jgi:putative ABC transport system substrate-binding protein